MKNCRLYLPQGTACTSCAVSGLPPPLSKSCTTCLKNGPPHTRSRNPAAPLTHKRGAGGAQRLAGPTLGDHPTPGPPTMPATSRKAAGTSLVDSLEARIRTRPVDNFASIKTYYRSATLDLRQVGMAPWPTGDSGRRAVGAPAEPPLAACSTATHHPCCPCCARRPTPTAACTTMTSCTSCCPALPGALASPAAPSARRVASTAGQAGLCVRERPLLGTPPTHLPPLAPPLPLLPATCSMVIETIPRHRAFVRKDPEYQQLEKVGRRPSWRGSDAAALICGSQPATRCPPAVCAMPCLQGLGSGAVRVCTS